MPKKKTDPFPAKKVVRLVNKWRARLGLPQWRIRILWKKGKTYYGKTGMGDYHETVIRLSRTHIRTKRDLESTIVHELLHLHESHLRNLMRVVCKVSVGGKEGRSIWKFYKIVQEYSREDIAQALCDHYGSKGAR